MRFCSGRDTKSAIDGEEPPLRLSHYVSVDRRPKVIVFVKQLRGVNTAEKYGILHVMYPIPRPAGLDADMQG